MEPWEAKCNNCREEISRIVAFYQERKDILVAYCLECTHIDAATNSQDVMLMQYQQHKDVAKRAREREADKTKTVAAKRPRVT